MAGRHVRRGILTLFSTARRYILTTTRKDHAVDAVFPAFGNARPLPWHDVCQAAAAGILRAMPEADPIADEDLMLRYQAGDAAAFECLYQRHRGPVFRYLLRQVGDRGQAEELFQDVWTNLIRSRASYTVSAKFSTFLYQVAHNRAIDHFRRQRGEISLDAANEDDNPLVDQLPANPLQEPSRQAESRQLGARLAAAIAALPDVQREAFLLKEEAGLSVEDIAAATGVGFETAKSRLRYALNRLREELQGWW